MERRPDPDELLKQVHRQEARARRGKLRIFFGAAAGVGKTYAMLEAARRLKEQGAEVVVGLAETHGRAETELLLEGLERVPLREIQHRGQTLRELDIDAALARHPALILVDELAHTNIAGSRHPKRWMDVEELLDAGIDVFTTVNVQHIESLNDIVGGITGIRVWETVPDRIFDQADEVIVVDLPPDELLQRLRQGKVYLPQQAEQALRNFFRKGNLIALRELALRRTADRVDDEMRAYRREQRVIPIWQTRDSLLACVGPDSGGEKIVRSAARLASRLGVPWHAIYVETPRLQRLPPPARARILGVLQLARELGADTATVPGNDIAATIAAYARSHNLARIVLGHDRRRGWSSLWRGSLTERIDDLAPELDLTRIGRAENERDESPRETGHNLFTLAAAQWRGRSPGVAYAGSIALCALATLMAVLLRPLFDTPNLVMIFLLAVVLIAVRWGRGPAALGALLSVLAFDFFCVPPRFSLSVSDVQYLLTFLVMLTVALVTGHLTANLQYQARVAVNRELRSRALYELARELSGALQREQIAEISARFAAGIFQAQSCLLLGDDNDRPVILSSAADLSIDSGVARWAFDHGEAAGAGTDTLPGSALLYLPLRAPMRIRGVLVLRPPNKDWLLTPEQRRLLETFASLIAIAIERVHYVDVARSTTVQIESERLRNSLLSALSHDLRTPLTAVIGLAESLSFTQPPLSDQQRDIATSIHDEARRMSALVNNLLEMGRLQAGAVRLDRQWQPLEEVIGAALAQTRQLLVRHRVEVRLDPTLPLLEFDAVLIERVLFNLLENAQKYTPPGSLIEITATVVGEAARISVSDNGPGFPAGKEEQIFEKFTRAQRTGSGEDPAPGMGLGLAICRAIIEAHHGRIWAERSPAGGARFSFTLPLGNPPEVNESSPLLPPDATP